MKSMRQCLCSILFPGEPSGKSASGNKFDVTALLEKKKCKERYWVKSSQNFRYTCSITPMRAMSLRDQSSCHCVRATQLLIRKNVAAVASRWQPFPI